MPLIFFTCAYCKKKIYFPKPCHTCRNKIIDACFQCHKSTYGHIRQSKIKKYSLTGYDLDK